MVASELGSQGYGIFGGVISALKDIIHHRAANVLSKKSPPPPDRPLSLILCYSHHSCNMKF